MNTVDKINLILKEAGISKVNLAKYLGVSRQMIYNYFDSNDLSKLSNDKCQLLFKLLGVKNEKELSEVEINDIYLQEVGSKIFTNSRKSTNVPKKNEVIELSGLRREEQELISDIIFLLKEMLNDDKTQNSMNILTYLYHFLMALGNTKEIKYILAYISKATGYTDPTVCVFEEDRQYTFESILYSAFTLYNNGGASKSKLIESHKRWEAELSRKNEEKMSRTQELNTAKAIALKELGYTEINEQNASEVFDKIAEIQSRYV